MSKDIQKIINEALSKTTFDIKVKTNHVEDEIGQDTGDIEIVADYDIKNSDLKSLGYRFFVMRKISEIVKSNVAHSTNSLSYSNVHDGKKLYNKLTIKNGTLHASCKIKGVDTYVSKEEDVKELVQSLMGNMNLIALAILDACLFADTISEKASALTKKDLLFSFGYMIPEGGRMSGKELAEKILRDRGDLKHADAYAYFSFLHENESFLRAGV